MAVHFRNWAWRVNQAIGETSLLSVWGNITGTLSAQTDLQTALNTANASAAWGSITGTLSAQTDLSSALSGKASTAVFTDVANGLAPLSGGGTTNFLRADGSWVAPPGSTVSDVAYGVSWDGDTTAAPSKNAVYDKIEALAGGTGLTHQQVMARFSIGF